MVSGTLNRQTDEIEQDPQRAGFPLRRHLRRDAAAHAARGRDRGQPKQARAANADLIVTVGGGSITDGAKAVQLCLANDIRTVDGDRHAFES